MCSIFSLFNNALFTIVTLLSLPNDAELCHISTVEVELTLQIEEIFFSWLNCGKKGLSTRKSNSIYSNERATLST